ncbi:hypothetical protein ACO22_01770 [Paracoccidioides brasiliensis]|uniref:Uncharacterized protein n=1 Tax=Paracoccidioides brasiliensis TaxID=121759 RepID=A0A1D2JKN4_PARBR|nr:hypothetical protein ACO22_01770 [Paracoccidioides brasiliensis]
MRSIPKNHKRPGQNGSTKMLGRSNSNILPLETSVNETGSVRKASQALGHNLESWKVKKFSLTIAPTPQREEGKGNIGATLKPSLTRPIVEGEDRVKISFGQIVRSTYGVALLFCESVLHIVSISSNIRISKHARNINQQQERKKRCQRMTAVEARNPTNAIDFGHLEPK